VKSAVALEVAALTGAEIVSVDSMQVYRRMDIGTAKPSEAERERVRHHMIDVVEPSESYTVAEFQEAARSVVAESDAPLLVVGGSGLHFRAVVDPMEFAPTDAEVRTRVEALGHAEARALLLEGDPGAQRHVDLDNPRRVTRALEVLELTGATPSERAESDAARRVREYEPLLPVAAVGVDPGDGLAAIIEARFDRMLEAGLLGEVSDVARDWGVTASQAVGYRELAPVLRGDYDLAEGRRRAIDATRALAKRQRTFFRRDPRVAWLDRVSPPTVLAALREAGWTS
jgi:tRNA dimethylallyltransferase